MPIIKKSIALLSCLIAIPLFAQDAPSELEKPGEYHQHLKMMAGTWDVKSKFYLVPGQTIEMNGVEVAKMQPGGFWLISDFTGKFMGQPFHGHGVMGYEAHRKKYVGMWVDTIASVMVTSTGNCTKDGKVHTMIGKSFDPMQKREVTYKQVTIIRDANTKTFHLYDVQGKKETLIMEQVCRRRTGKIKLNAKVKGPFTHEIAGPFEAVYYLTGPQQARPPEGKFKSGTKVKLLRNAGSYSQVQSESGIIAYVATGALKPIKKN